LEKLVLPADDAVRHRVEVSLSKSELEDLYAPYKPPSKGTLEDRILQQHPQLVDSVNQFWMMHQQQRSQGNDNNNHSAKILPSLQPFGAAITVLANRIKKMRRKVQDVREL
jgi:transcriptional accessory protein Tex/SPT6